MDSGEQNILVLGLPDTGKSSFIQALDEALKHPSGQKDIRSSKLAVDRTYLQNGKEKFLAGEKLVRTERPLDDTSVELWFEDPTTGKTGKLHLPDKKGEVFQDQWIHRQWDREYRDALARIGGAFVFVRADGKSRNDELLGVLAADGADEVEVERPWDMKNASAQVQLVDVLQFIAEQSDVSRPLRLAVIVSAWDTVGAEGDNRPTHPGKFLDREWALVAQYLRANPEQFVLRVYGASAYGGVPGELGELLEKAPHERSRIIDGDEVTPDFTRPLRWLLALE